MIEKNERIEDLIHELKNILDAAESQFLSFQAESGLPCPSTCGDCCYYPDISCYPFELYPLAYQILKNENVDDWIKRLDQHSSSTCVLLQQTNPELKIGKCGAYAYRPFVCRAFGVSGLRDKFGQMKLSICKKLKMLHQHFMAQDNAHEELSKRAPEIRLYLEKMRATSMDYSQELMPLNSALKVAIEKVALWHHFQNLSVDRDNWNRDCL